MGGGNLYLFAINSSHIVFHHIYDDWQTPIGMFVLTEKTELNKLPDVDGNIHD